MLQLLAASGVSGDLVSPAFAAIDKLDRAGESGTRSHLLANSFSASQADAVFAVAALRGREALAAAVGASETPIDATAFGELLDALEAMGLSDFVEVDFSIVRGLAYYTGTVFELFDRQGTFRAICGGGRYDTLLASLGGVDLPAVGFGMGDVVLGELLKDRGLRPVAPASIECYVAAVTPEDIPGVLALAHQIRDAGIAAEYSLTPAGLGKQLKSADARGARLAIVIGPDDRARGEVQIKHLGDKHQEAVPLSKVVARCQAMLTSTG